VQIPTTVLSQVDSSVGGKTGVNLPDAKNMVGTFHQPSHVFADVDTLDSLPKRRDGTKASLRSSSTPRSRTSRCSTPSNKSPQAKAT